MNQSKKPIWKKSMLQNLSHEDVITALGEMMENGDMYGYDRDEEWHPDEQGYYQEYRPLFEEIAANACDLWEAMQERDVSEHWDDMTVALLGQTHKVLGYDAIEMDYYHMLGVEEEWAGQEAGTRILRLTKAQMLNCFREVMVTLMAYADLKAAHDCLTSIVEELDARSMVLSRKNDAINLIYHDLTGGRAAEFDALVATLPQRMWVE